MEERMLTLKGKSFQNFDDAADSILKMISKIVDMNTIFIAKNDKKTNRIVKAVNTKEVLLDEGDELPFKDTYCKLSVDHGREILVIEDITKNDLSQPLQVTENLGSGSFIGIPIYYENGDNYGTICGLDTNNINFSDQHIEIFETMASLLTYVLELDKANQQIQTLSAPLVPVTKGVAILPIIGEITASRAENIIHTALAKSQEYDLDYLIIDLSAVTHINATVSEALLKLANILGIIGVKPILTGFQPVMALNAIQVHADLKDILIESTLERALERIGFTLVKDN
ncbi:GAF domain-containing protein [Paenisporosarcina quisquiliarum]|uniref:GAF domain-containing protein n=1 Tax=Paenisporosarcina quisquiliarum TaxID=365346 RepID=A0A9X3LF63_9BACL|nr:STAS domain-containing protein [Paenisporosarcina quisquiliarum]MCZ8536857.1 GAF domain-containing protein [Paenisporosarcina quisquiliarum]